MPLLGMGTYRLESCASVVEEGLRVGYRLIDTAQLYRNHADVARGIAASGVDREDIFLTSKVHVRHIKSLRIAEAVQQILRELDTGYLDLLLLHNPVKNFTQAWRDLVHCCAQYDIRHIGVSNFEEHHVDAILHSTGVPPWLNQVELNVFRQRRALVAHHCTHSIPLQSHTTLARGELLDDPALQAQAGKCAVTPSQFMYHYALDQGIGVLPCTRSSKHLKSNFDLLAQPAVVDVDAQGVQDLHRDFTFFKRGAHQASPAAAPRRQHSVPLSSAPLSSAPTNV